MALGTSLFLIALGAILKFAVHTSVSGLSIATIGVILMVIGVLGLVLSFLLAPPWRRDTVAAGPVVREREVL